MQGRRQELFTRSDPRGNEAETVPSHDTGVPAEGVSADGELSGFSIGVTAVRCGWEQATIFSARGAHVVYAPAVGGPWENEVAVRRAGVGLIRAASLGSVDAITFVTASAVDDLFRLAAAAGCEAGLRWALEVHTLAACAGGAAAAARSWSVPSPLEVESDSPEAVADKVTAALTARVAVLPAGGHPVEVRGRLVRGQHSTVELTGRERMLLATLARGGGVVSKDVLLRDVWGPFSAQAHTVEVTIGRLREKIEPLGLDVRTARRRGYWLDGAGRGRARDELRPLRSPPR